MRNRVLTCLALTLILAAGAQAQQPSASHAQAVEELFLAMNMSQVLDHTIESVECRWCGPAGVVEEVPGVASGQDHP